MGIKLIRSLERGLVINEHDHVLSGAANLLYLVHHPVNSI